MNKYIPFIFLCLSLLSCTPRSIKNIPIPNSQDPLERLAQESNYSKQKLSHLNSLKRSAASYLRNTKHSDSKKPQAEIPFGEYIFKTENLPGRYHPVLYRKPKAKPGSWSEVFDIQSILKDTSVFTLHSLKIRNDGKAIAAIASSKENGERALFISDLETKKTQFIKNNIDHVAFSDLSNNLYLIEQKASAPKTLHYFNGKISALLTMHPKALS